MGELQVGVDRAAGSSVSNGRSSRDRPASTWRLIRTLIHRQVLVQTKRSTVGLIWPAISPFLLLALYIFVFGAVFKVPIPRYGDYLFAGLLPWAFVAQCIGQAIGSVSSESDLIRRAKFPYATLPIACVGVNAIYLLTDLVVFVGYLAIRGRVSWPLLLALPLCIIPTLLITASIALVMSLIDVYNHDLRKVQGNLLTIWFFLLPVVYRQNMAPKSILVLRSIDPMNMTIGAYRQVLYYHHLSRPLHLTIMVGLSVALFAACLAIFNRSTRDLAKDV